MDKIQIAGEKSTLKSEGRSMNSTHEAQAAKERVIKDFRRW